MQKFWKLDKPWILGALAIMLAALLWSLDGTFIRPKLYLLPADLVVFVEHALGFIILAPFIMFGWQKIIRLTRKDWAAIIWVCAFGGLIGTIMITKAFFAAIGGEVTFATVVILQKLQPVFALLMARIILGEKLKGKFYLWAAVAVLAGYFLAFGKTGLNLTDINFLNNAAVFAVIAAFAFGSSTVFGKKIVNHLDFKTTAALRFGLTALLALALIAISGSVAKFNSISFSQWQYFALIVFTSGAAAMFIYYYGLKRVTASVATLCELFWPLSAVFLDYFINKNILSPLQILSSIVLLFAFFKIVKEGKAQELEFIASVKPGSGQGARLGFPTINLDKIDLNIDYGVYLVEVKTDNNYKGLLHFGLKETFAEGPSLELFIKERIDGIENKRFSINIIKKIREIKKFADIKALKAQIEKDLEEIR